MRCIIVLMLSAFVSSSCAEEPKTPDALVGRWIATRIQKQGERVKLDKDQLVFEFTTSQMQMRLDGRTPYLAHVFDCFTKTENGFQVLDLKTAASSPGPKSLIHIQAIFEIEGGTLRICKGHSDDATTPGKRPTKFVSSTESKSDLYVLRRDLD